LRDVLARIELVVKCLRFHKLRFPLIERVGNSVAI
jgi:hypothetical protein